MLLRVSLKVPPRYCRRALAPLLPLRLTPLKSTLLPVVHMPYQLKLSLLSEECHLPRNHQGS